ncbi:MAG TPA: hypothetical protein VMN38_03670 [Sphingomicrobium sp.]|nr:hypothetical protein [Sphingomicrobium sp.]
MYIENAYLRRESLSDRDLERLHTALKDETDRYRYTIRNYPSDRLEKYGLPFLQKLEAKVADVERLIDERAQHGS